MIMLKINNKSMFSVLRNVGVFQVQSRCASNEGRQAKMLQKLLTGKRKPTFRFTERDASPKFDSIDVIKKGSTKTSIRRTAMLNKMFMRHLTDLIASGPIGYELSGFGLQITGVKIGQNYHILKIYWNATSAESIDFVEKKLESIKFQLRHELHQLQLMGNIPHLTFVRDHDLGYFDDLDKALETADYGEDFQPTLQRLRDKGFEMHGEENKPPDYVENNKSSSIPPMKHDVFGLDHALIMGRVKQSMAKSKQAWDAFERKQLSPTTTKPFTFNKSFESIRQEQMSDKQAADVLKEFLQKRKLQHKLKRAENAELNANTMYEEDCFDGQDDGDDYDSDEQFIDEADVYKIYDELEPHEK